MQTTLSQSGPVDVQFQITHVDFGGRRIQQNMPNRQTVPEVALHAFDLPAGQPNAQVKRPARTRLRFHHPKTKARNDSQQQHQNRAEPNQKTAQEP